MPLVTFFSVLELPKKKRKGGCNNPPLVRRGLGPIVLPGTEEYDIGKPALGRDLLSRISSVNTAFQ